MGEPTADSPGPPGGPSWIGLWIEPLDPLFFRDGRPFDAASRAVGGLPQPRTAAGAVRTALLAARGFDFRAFGKLRESGGKTTIREALAADSAASPHLIEARFRGPWLARWNRVDARAEPLLPAPANLYRVAGWRERSVAVWSREGWVTRTRESRSHRHEVFRADPLPEGVELPGWGAATGEDGRRPLWRRQRGKPHPVGEYVTLRGIAEFLDGRVPRDDKDPAKSHLVGPEELFAFDDRVGVAIGPDSLTGIDSMLFSTRLLALREDVGFYVEVSWPAARRGELEAGLKSPFPFGGEGRYARAWVIDLPVRWPDVEPPPGGISVHLLATPGLFGPPAGGGRGFPEADRLAGAGIIATAAGRPVAVSGWDVARGRPRPTRFAAPAGTVFFAKGRDVPGRASLCGDDELAAEGWGFTLRGVIKDDR